MRIATLTGFLLLALTTDAARGQTLVDLRTQSKSIDFTAAASTSPFQAGTVLPAICTAGAMFFKTDAPAGSNLYGCSAVNLWTLEGGGGGSSLTVASQLTDLALTRASGSSLSIGGNCAPATPCGVRFGAVSYSITTGATVTLTAGTGFAYVYIANTGALTVGTTLTATCSTGCQLQTGVVSFPVNCIPLFIWSATSGNWDVSGGVDYRAFLSGKNVIAGTGLTSAEAAGATSLAVDSTVIGLRTSVPATSSTACNATAWATDGSYYYLCVSTNTWKRVAILTW